MKKLFILSAFLICVASLTATTIVVDINGGGQFTTIQAAINAASSGDTVKVWPGTYSSEQINLNKNIVLMGSGYETTIITGNFNPMVKVTSGLCRIQWFLISSIGGDGVNISGGTILNCCVVACSGDGIDNVTAGTTASVVNCITHNNAGYGIRSSGGSYGSPSTLNVTDCISRENGSEGFRSDYYGILNLSYSCGSTSGTSGNQGVINVNPGFTSSPVDFHISEGSSCWNTGNPSLLDPDGSRSDMGYFGGPDCPIYPVVVEILIEPNGDNINLKAKARANY